MERPTDTYKETHNMRIADRDTTFEGQVSRLQIAELTAACCSNPDIAFGKCMEVVAETSAPLLDLTDLLEGATVEVTKVCFCCPYDLLNSFVCLQFYFNI